MRNTAAATAPAQNGHTVTQATAPASAGEGEVERTAGDLLAIVADAVGMRPWEVIPSIFGPPREWVPPFARFSEYKAFDLWHPLQTARTLLNWTLPSAPLAPPTFGPPLLNDLFYQPTVILQRPDHAGNHTTFPDEHWFFVNGIMTNSAIAQLNSAFLSQLFHRPITMIQNSTDSFWVDLVQCALGKHWAHMTEPAIVAFPAIYDALTNPHKQRVVVVAHSQGTIIMANVLNWLYEIVEKAAVPMVAEAGAPKIMADHYAGPQIIYPDPTKLRLDEFAPLTLAQLRKLEVYCFATCANQLTYFPGPAGDDGPLPHLEHFANEHDVVARLGMLAPRGRVHKLDIQGESYMRPGAKGHFLNQHYLFAIEAAQRLGRRKQPHGGSRPFIRLASGTPQDAHTPRLYGYINGGTPEEVTVS